MCKVMGHGDVLDCAGRALSQVVVRKVQGVVTEVAIAVDGRPYHGLHLSPAAPPEQSWAPTDQGDRVNRPRTLRPLSGALSADVRAGGYGEALTCEGHRASGTSSETYTP
jgi:hypothetical protein